MVRWEWSDVCEHRTLNHNVRFFIFQRDIQGKDKGIGDLAWHVGMTRTMVEDKAFDETGIRGRLMLHFHDFDHMEIDGPAVTLNGQNGIDDGRGEGVGHVSGDLGSEGGLGDGQERFTVLSFQGDFEFFQKLAHGLG